MTFFLWIIHFDLNLVLNTLYINLVNLKDVSIDAAPVEPTSVNLQISHVQPALLLLAVFQRLPTDGIVHKSSIIAVWSASDTLTWLKIKDFEVYTFPFLTEDITENSQWTLFLWWHVQFSLTSVPTGSRRDFKYFWSTSSVEKILERSRKEFGYRKLSIYCCSVINYVVVDNPHWIS